MRSFNPGLRGKFLGALLVAVVVPLLAGLILLATSGFHQVLAERGKLHRMQALTLVRALDQASIAQGGQFRSWLAADPVLIEFISAGNQALATTDPAAIAAETRRLDAEWLPLSPDDPRVTSLLENPGSRNLQEYQAHHPKLAEILVTEKTGRLMAATGKTTDIDQADEAWWHKGKQLERGSQWIDSLRCDQSSNVFSLDVVLPLYDGEGFAGVVKMSVDVTSLFNHLGFDGEELGQRWEIVLPDGRLLASSKPGYVSMSEALSPVDLANLKSSEQSWTIMVNNSGEKRMAGFVPIGAKDEIPDTYVVFSSRKSDVVAPLRRRVVMVGLAGSLLVAGCALGGYLYVDRKILRPLSALGQAARSISTSARLRHLGAANEEEVRQSRDQAEQDLEKIKKIHTADEVEALAGDLAVMTTRVLRYQRELESEVAAKTAVMREDLEMAREFQNALLPSTYPEVPSLGIRNPLRLRFAHFYQPASTVGGDFFDLIELDENRVGVIIADVMGHGARSALVTAIMRALVKNHSDVASDPGAFLSELNTNLHELISRSGQSMFVTAFYIVLDTRTGLASWAVSGHPSPLRVRRGSDNKPEPLWLASPRQPALGLMPKFAFETTESPLQVGDVFLLFTDGTIEAENPAGEAFGVHRLIESLDAALDGPMAAMPAKIICDVGFFQKRKNYEDDVCIVAIEASGGDAPEFW